MKYPCDGCFKASCLEMKCGPWREWFTEEWGKLFESKNTVCESNGSGGGEIPMANVCSVK